MGALKIKELLAAVDEYLVLPTRDLDKPVYLPIEQVFSIPGRGTVVTGRLERGILKKGDEVEIKGLDKTFKTTVTSTFHPLSLLLYY